MSQLSFAEMLGISEEELANMGISLDPKLAPQDGVRFTEHEIAEILASTMGSIQPEE